MDKKIRKQAEWKPGSVAPGAISGGNGDQVPPPKLGIFFDVPFDVYQSWRAINNGLLGHAAKSLRHFQEQRTNPVWKQSASQRKGVICHTALLEPRLFRKKYAVMPDFADQVRRPDGTLYDNPKATSLYKQLVHKWEEDNCDRERLDADEWEMAMALQSAIFEQLSQEDLELLNGPSEASIVWIDQPTGLRCKARLDKICAARQVIVDLKTTKDVRRFADREIPHWGYDRQMAFYCDGLRAVRGSEWDAYLLAVEPERPYGMVGSILSERYIERGRRQYRQLLDAIAQAEQCGQWPGYPQPVNWDMPAWLLKAEESDGLVELIINGSSVEV